MDILLKLVFLIIFISGVIALLFLPLILAFRQKRMLTKDMKNNYEMLDLEKTGGKKILLLIGIMVIAGGIDYYFTHEVSFLLFWLVWFSITYYLGTGRSRVYYNDEMVIIGNINYYGGLIKFRWSDVKKIEWDRDVKQNEWGIKFYLYDKKQPVRHYFFRKDKDQVDEILRKYCLIEGTNEIK